jgi:hypothetical protein
MAGRFSAFAGGPPDYFIEKRQRIKKENYN